MGGSALYCLVGLDIQASQWSPLRLQGGRGLITASVHGTPGSLLGFLRHRLRLGEGLGHLIIAWPELINGIHEWDREREKAIDSFYITGQELKESEKETKEDGHAGV